MSIKQKAMIFVVAKAILSLALVIYIFTSLDNQTSIIDTELPIKIKDLNQSVYIKYLSEKTLHYDEVLTQSARNYAFTNDEKWKERYLINERALKNTIQNALDKGTDKELNNFQNLSKANDRLVELEYLSFDLTRKGKNLEALSKLDSDEYQTLKEKYTASLEDYRDSKDQEIEAILSNIEHLVTEHDKKEQALAINLKISFSLYAVIIFSITWTFLFLFMRLIVSGLLRLKEGAEKIKEGNFNFRIDLNSKDEFEDLATAFNSMAANLDAMTKKVNEKALKKELANQRNAFSRELHDRLGIIISSIKLQLNELKLNAFENDSKDEKFLNCEKLIDEAYSQIREISDNPLPESITEKGLKKSLSELFSRTEMIFKVPVKFITNINEEDFPDHHKASIYSLIRELLNNTVKHAKATKVICQIIRHDESLLMMFEDDGVGFDTKPLSLSKGRGMKNLKERTDLLGAQLNIDSQPGKGTTITLEFPLFLETLQGITSY